MAETVTLEFLAKQMERVLVEQATLRDDMAVLLGMMQRLDGAMQGLEVRAMHARHARLDQRVRALKDRDA